MKILKSTLVIAALAAMPVVLAYNPQAKKSTASKTSTKKAPVAGKKQAQRKTEEKAVMQTAPQRTFQSLMADIRKEKDHNKIIQNGVFTESFKQSVFNADLDDVLTQTLFEAGRNLHVKWPNNPVDDTASLAMTDSIIDAIMESTPTQSPLLGETGKIQPSKSGSQKPLIGTHRQSKAEKVSMPGLPFVPGEEESMAEFTAKREFKRGATTPAPTKEDWMGEETEQFIPLRHKLQPAMISEETELVLQTRWYNTKTNLFTQEFLEKYITQEVVDACLDYAKLQYQSVKWNLISSDQKIGYILSYIYDEIKSYINDWATKYQEKTNNTVSPDTNGRYALIKDQIRQYLKANAKKLGL